MFQPGALRVIAARHCINRHLIDCRSYQTAFLFPGQGVQRVGMAQICGKMTENNLAMREIMQLYETASSIVGYDLHHMCTHGPAEELNTTRVAQVAIFVTSMAALAKMKHEQPDTVHQCSVAMGLSLGEYSALCFAGAMTFEDGVRLTHARGEAMQMASDLYKGGIVAITGLGEDDVQRLCREVASSLRQEGEATPLLTIGSHLGERNFAVSGDLDACVALQVAALEEPGVKVSKLLEVSGAFHTLLMLPASQALSEELDKVTFTPANMTCPVYSNVTGDTSFFHHSSDSDIKTALLNQLVQPVQWSRSMALLLSSPSFVQAYEIGPGTVCSGIVKMFNRRAKVTSFQL